MSGDYDEHLMVWEEEASSAVEILLKHAEYDEIRGTVTLPPRDGDKDFGAEFSDLEELESYLVDIYNEAWYAYVPFDGGSAVFEDDAIGVVGDILYSYADVVDFFEKLSPPQNALELVTAQQLLESANSSRVVRISLDEINDELVRYLAKHPEKMREMSPRKFEELIADLFNNQGFQVTLTPRSKDGGMDVIAVQRDGIGTVMVIVECKRYAEGNKVGVEIARGLYGVVEQQRATRGIIATTSFFTKGVVDFRKTIPHRLGLADFDVLSNEIQKWKSRIC
ncbi:restriction endonuclease [bacterium]|nr:restriction endonuclease [bacterium]